MIEKIKKNKWNIIGFIMALFVIINLSFGMYYVAFKQDYVMSGYYWLVATFFLVVTNWYSKIRDDELLVQYLSSLFAKKPKYATTGCSPKEELPNINEKVLLAIDTFNGTVWSMGAYTTDGWIINDSFKEFSVKAWWRLPEVGDVIDL